MKMQKLLFPMMAMISLSAVAAPGNSPREHANCPIRSQIVEPENSQGYWMSEDCKTAYVLPPALGKIQVSPISSPDSMQTCNAIIGSVNALSTQTNALNAKVSEKAKLLASIARDRAACGPVHNAQKTFQDNSEQMNKKLAEMQAQLDTANQTVADCTAKQTSTPACDRASRQSDRLNEQISRLNDRIQDQASRLDTIQDKVAACEARYPHSRSDDSEGIKAMEDLNAKITVLTKAITTERTRLSNQAGGDASLVFKSSHAEIVGQFNSRNQNLGVNFVMMPVKKATIHFQQVDDGSAAKLASVSRFTIFGERAKDQDAVPADGASVDGVQNTSRLFGGTVGAQISLNLYAACRLRQQFPDLSSAQARQAVANLIRPTVTYTYEVQATKDIQINFNENLLYQLIKQHSTHGGLFWSSSSESITETTTADRWLTIVESSEDSDLKWENGETLLMALRREVLDSSLGRVAKKTYGTPQEAFADGGTPPEDGAKVAAKNLRKFPNFYCQVAAIALDIGDALFGGSSSSGSTTKTMRTSDVQNLIINGMVTFAGSQSFAGAGE